MVQVANMKFLSLFCFICLWNAVKPTATSEVSELSDMNGEDWIAALNLLPNRYENSSYVSEAQVFGSVTEHLPKSYPPGEVRYEGSWSYLLLNGTDVEYFSYFRGHRVVSHVRGRTLNVYVLHPRTGELTVTSIGPREDQLVVVIPAGFYAAMRLERQNVDNPFSLVSITATPELDITDFELLTRDKIPRNTDKLDRRVIRRLIYKQ